MEITYQRDLVEALFLERQNRFVGLVQVQGREELAHVPSSGRMGELLYPGATVFLLPQDKGNRKTPYNLVLAQDNGHLVSVDSHLPNRLVAKCLAKGLLLPLGGIDGVEREVAYGASRMDFRLWEGGQACYVEVKSVTLVRQGRGLFPDAPTLRGTRHLQELVAARAEGQRAVVLFVIQRGDAQVFSPNGETDPAFANALVTAARAGVEVYAYDCLVSKRGVGLGREIPVQLSPQKM